MDLSTGTRLGPYEIVALGAGGMGEVYRARDTRLDRTVAIKVLNSALIASPDSKARFDREAKTISQLNHPNICMLFDVEHQDGTDYLVMEFLQGESLADRLKRGPLPLPDVVKIGSEIAACWVGTVQYMSPEQIQGSEADAFAVKQMSCARENFLRTTTSPRSLSPTK